jgi:type I restriction enzyme, S subunit
VAKGTRTGGREATRGVIPGRISLSVGRPRLPEPDGFEWRLLADVARLESGHTPSRSHDEYWGGKIPWIGIRDATGNHGRIIDRTLDYVTQAGLDNSSARLLPTGTVCLSRTASVGFVVEMGRPMATSQDFVNWVCGPELNGRYLRYILMLEQDSVRRFAHGTTHQTMYYPEAKALNVLMPSRSRQDAIVDLLGALDDKIAANDRQGQLALDLADAEFARAVSDAPTSAETFGDLAEIGGGGTPTTSVDEYWHGQVPWATPTDVTGLKGPYLSTTNRMITDRGLAICSSKLYPKGSILMTSRATIGAFAIAQVPIAVNQGFIVVNANDPAHQLWLFHEMRSRVSEFISHANGATFLELSRGKFKHFQVRIPASDGARSFSKVAQPLHESAAQSMVEAASLAATRDELLPLLMSGKVRVRDAEIALEEVV